MYMAHNYRCTIVTYRPSRRRSHGYITSASSRIKTIRTRALFYVIVIVIAATGSRLVRQRLHTGHYVAPQKRHQKRYQAEDRSRLSCFICRQLSSVCGGSLYLPFLSTLSGDHSRYIIPIAFTGPLGQISHFDHFNTACPYAGPSPMTLEFNRTVCRPSALWHLNNYLCLCIYLFFISTISHGRPACICSITPTIDVRLWFAKPSS